MTVVTLLAALFDPRGRCNRRGLFITAMLMLGVEIATSGLALATGWGLDSTALLPVKLVLFYVALSVAARRLHDMGMSAWSMLWAAMVLLGWAFAFTFAVMVYIPPEQFTPGETGFSIVFAGVGLPLLAMLLWMHFAQGTTMPNRYGPVPGGLGFSRHEGRRREAPDASAGAMA